MGQKGFYFGSSGKKLRRYFSCDFDLENLNVEREMLLSGSREDISNLGVVNLGGELFYFDPEKSLLKCYDTDKEEVRQFVDITEQLSKKRSNINISGSYSINNYRPEGILRSFGGPVIDHEGKVFLTLNQENDYFLINCEQNECSVIDYHTLTDNGRFVLYVFPIQKKEDIIKVEITSDNEYDSTIIFGCGDNQQNSRLGKIKDLWVLDGFIYNNSVILNGTKDSGAGCLISNPLNQGETRWKIKKENYRFDIFTIYDNSLIIRGRETSAETYETPLKQSIKIIDLGKGSANDAGFGESYYEYVPVALRNNNLYCYFSEERMHAGYKDLSEVDGEYGLRCFDLDEGKLLWERNVACQSYTCKLTDNHLVFYGQDPENPQEEGGIHFLDLDTLETTYLPFKQEVMDLTPTEQGLVVKTENRIDFLRMTSATGKKDAVETPEEEKPTRLNKSKEQRRKINEKYQSYEPPEVRKETPPVSLEDQFGFLGETGLCNPKSLSRDEVLESTGFSKEQMEEEEPYLLLLIALASGNFDVPLHWDDMETIYSAGGYVDLLLEIEEVSGQELSFQNPDAYFEEDEVVLSFEINGESYRWELEYLGDYIHPEFFSKINDLAEEWATENRLALVETGGQDFVMGWLDTEQVSRLREEAGMEVSFP